MPKGGLNAPLADGPWRQLQPFINCFLAATMSYQPNGMIGGGILFMGWCMLPILAGGATAAEISW